MGFPPFPASQSDASFFFPYTTWLSRLRFVGAVEGKLQNDEIFTLEKSKDRHNNGVWFLLAARSVLWEGRWIDAIGRSFVLI